MIEEKNEKDLIEESTFSDFELKKEILEAIKAIGYIKPTDIQREAIPKVLEGKDVVGLAQTGTGKTAAFGLPSLSNISEEKVVQSLVICPTRELAKQIQEEYKKFLSGIRSINAACVYGGEERYKQKKLMKKLRPQIIIGTPGRIIDFIKDGVIDLSNITSVILDEADEMLNMGFIDDIRRILSETPDERQTLLFSATMPKEIERIVSDFQKDPEVVRIKRVSRTADTIEQTYYYVDRNQKSDLLIRILDYIVPNSCIIFCNTKAQVDDLNIYLKQNTILADALHGDLKQQQRDRVMKAFKDTKTHVLIATDVAARGIDVSNVEIVINYDLPQDNESYVHRIGRTGRAGNKGLSISFVTRNDRRRISDIERMTKSTMTLQHPPKIRDIKRNRYLKFIDELKGSITADNELSEKFVTKLMDEMSNEEIIVAFSNFYLNSIDKNYAELKDASKSMRSGRDRGGNGRDRGGNGRTESRKKGLQKDEVRLKSNIRKGARVTPRTIVEFLSNECNIPRNSFGDIEIQPNRTYICVNKRFAKKLISSTKGKQFAGKSVIIDESR